MENINNEIPNLEIAHFSTDKFKQLSNLENIALSNNIEELNIKPIQQEYLDKTIFPLLLEGISWIIKEKPKDPVEHLAMFLLKNNPKNSTDQNDNQKLSSNK